MGLVLSVFLTAVGFIEFAALLIRFYDSYRIRETFKFSLDDLRELYLLKRERQCLLEKIQLVEVIQFLVFVVCAG